MEYYVQVRICTLEELCSKYSDPKVIFKSPEKNVTKAFTIAEASPGKTDKYLQRRRQQTKCALAYNLNCRVILIVLL